MELSKNKRILLNELLMGNKNILKINENTGLKLGTIFNYITEFEKRGIISFKVNKKRKQRSYEDIEFDFNNTLNVILNEMKEYEDLLVKVLSLRNNKVKN